MAALVLALLLASVPVGLLATDRFPDVPTANPHHDDINQIAAAGITIGFPDGTYKPGAFVTRGQMASFLARTAGLGGRTPVANAATALTATTATTVLDGAITTAKLADGAATPAKIGSEGAAAGQMLTANGSGGASFQALPAPPTNAETVDGKSANELVRMTRSTIGGRVSLTDTFKTAATLTITAPAAGFILVNAAIKGDGTTNCPCVTVARLRDTGSGQVSATVASTVGTAGVNNQYQSMSPTYVFTVPAAGVRTIVLEAYLFSSAAVGPTVSVYEGVITAVYAPFGQSGGTTLEADDSAPSGDPRWSE